MLRNFNHSAHALAQKLFEEGINQQAVLDAIASIPRHHFVDEILAHKAYENTALPIGLGQTISQPYIVAKMTQVLLEQGVKTKVLEIGTGSGYQSAILAKVFTKVYSVERIKSLQWQAKRRLQNLDLYNVSMKHGDGWLGWQAKAPFDGIIVTAAAAQVPQDLLNQLADNGILISPIGEDNQKLIMFKRQGNRFIQQELEAVRFVPLISGDIA
ncbi:protein-L-isoaspartate(D-aspartate) O-methyltransferase [Pseudoalteromonas denitrificans]|uniref:Protein-L-isoaspartate O-methyltransferase n=1 Tax=Pseudoalteromonas denitrificans DSM 6059 TaxID=1123010 RepID=A0A1I1EJB6_9GAMM|nr:protein-L-isoaspartate(D-aspartate) O-methyltransferase [Pseudoalteromonas denitrificans]SFB87239.1 protein-L-isoaspartate(D-aspartate) O-methyltransferase [Pseudoalteromonas denitrificans DSM 6059]